MAQLTTDAQAFDQRKAEKNQADALFMQACRDAFKGRVCRNCGTPVHWNHDISWWEHSEECPEDTDCWTGLGEGPVAG